jgi:hypothetical protein
MTQEASLDFGGIVGRTLAILVRNLPALAVLALVLVGLPSYLLRGDLLDAGVLAEGFFSGLSLSGILLAIAQAVLVGAVVTGVAQDLAGQPSRAGDALAQAFGAIVPILGISIVVGLATSPLMLTQSIWGWLSLVLLWPLLALAIVLRIHWLVAIPASVVERLGISGALGRSRALTRGHRWTLFGYVILLWLVAGVLGWIAGLLFGLIGLDAAAGALALAVVAAFDAVATAVIYADLRRLKDGTAPEQLLLNRQAAAG